MIRPPPRSTLFPYPPLSRPPAELSLRADLLRDARDLGGERGELVHHDVDGVQLSSFAAEVTRVAKERSEEHTSELQSPDHLVCRLLLEKKQEQQPGSQHGST